MGQPKSSGKNTSHFAPSMKEVKQHRNSQSIYFVTGGVFEMDEEDDAEGGRKSSQGMLQFQFNIVLFLTAV